MTFSSAGMRSRPGGFNLWGELPMTTTLEPIEAEPKKRRPTKRRGAGEGSIFCRADGRWAATVTIGYDATGKRLRRTMFGKTKREVQDKLTAMQQSKQGGSLAPPSRMT